MPCRQTVRQAIQRKKRVLGDFSTGIPGQSEIITNKNNHVVTLCVFVVNFRVISEEPSHASAFRTHLGKTLLKTPNG